MDIQAIKHRFGIIGNSAMLDRAIDVARQVAPTDISVLINGESGVGKEVFPQIIHQLSSRKHKPYIAVNCGAIPEGTIDSELFGHEKGSFTGAHEARKGYFEEANGGTIFLDEVAELPLSTQVRLLRVLETGEFIKVGSSKVLKTDVRIVAATNVDFNEAISHGRFRQDLYYRLNTVPIYIPPLRERKEDVHLLFRKFASDFADKYRMPSVTLTSEAIHLLTGYRWPGNIRQLKNMVEQISIIEGDRNITASTLSRYLPDHGQMEMPVLYQGNKGDGADFSDRDILFKVLFDLRKENKEYRQEMQEMSQRLRRLEEFAMGSANLFESRTETEIKKAPDAIALGDVKIHPVMPDISEPEAAFSEVMEEPLSLQSKEFEMIRKALIRNNGHRKQAAIELGISERTLYRKIKEYKLDYLSTNKG